MSNVCEVTSGQNDQLRAQITLTEREREREQWKASREEKWMLSDIDLDVQQSSRTLGADLQISAFVLCG